MKQYLCETMKNYMQLKMATMTIRSVDSGIVATSVTIFSK